MTKPIPLSVLACLVSPVCSRPPVHQQEAVSHRRSKRHSKVVPIRVTDADATATYKKEDHRQQYSLPSSLTHRSMSFQLHPLEKNDIPHCVTIYFAAFQNAHSLGCWPRTPSVRSWWEASILDELHDSGAHWLKVVAANGVIAGFAKWYVCMSKTMSFERVVLLCNICFAADINLAGSSQASSRQQSCQSGRRVQILSCATRLFPRGSLNIKSCLGNAGIGVEPTLPTHLLLWLTRECRPRNHCHRSSFPRQRRGLNAIGLGSHTS